MNKKGLAKNLPMLLLIGLMSLVMLSAYVAANGKAAVHDPNTGEVVGQIETSEASCFLTPSNQMVCPGTPAETVGACIQQNLFRLPNHVEFLETVRNCVAEAGGPPQCVAAGQNTGTCNLTSLSQCCGFTGTLNPDCAEPICDQENELLVCPPEVCWI